ncbi:uncharacterized protein LOC113514506 isoform X2 [Galleria mellonella]|uniref:Uncharacterized protein LOC113514506 isoform X2 n=1 Tax=Galleria mellonella TaxID=7137 RepID=A0A6J3BS27_GALME|nr:uncharacterized protein LOC113514506 isoform X2 [Galleria mellonella]
MKSATQLVSWILMGSDSHLLSVCLYILLISVATSLAKYRKPIIKYPKDTQFWATDFFVRGCRNFLEKCPSSYKAQMICARNYNDWQVFKRERC